MCTHLGIRKVWSLYSEWTLVKNSPNSRGGEGALVELSSVLTACRWLRFSIMETSSSGGSQALSLCRNGIAARKARASLQLISALTAEHWQSRAMKRRCTFSKLKIQATYDRSLL